MPGYPLVTQQLHRKRDLASGMRCKTSNSTNPIGWLILFYRASAGARNAGEDVACYIAPEGSLDQKF